MHLDAKSVAALELGGKRDAIHFDDDLPGFGHRLRRGAGDKVLRSWVVQYRRAGASRRLLLGSGSVLNAEQARIAARKVLAKVALGEDPQGDKLARRDKDQQTLRSIIGEYLPAKEKELRPRSLREMTRYLTNRPYFGPLHGMPIDTVSRRDIARRLVAIGRESGSVTADRARAALSGFFTWAMQMGLAELNPTINVIKANKSPPRQRLLVDKTRANVADELVAIWKACGDDDHGRIVKLLILTACRRAEIGGMRWSELDLEKGEWTIPASRCKNKRAHTLPLLPAVTGIIAAVPRMATRDQLFGVRDRAGFSSWGRGKRELDERCGVRDWTLHDIRRSVATGMGNLGVQPHVIEALLNHVSGHKAGVAGTYNRSPYEREVRAALALWEDHVRTLVEGGERKVVAFTPAAAS